MSANGPALCLDLAAPPGEYGERPIMVTESAHCDECGRAHEIEKCPRCGAWIFPYWGMCPGGGFGEYKICDGDPPCGWYWKRVWDHNEE